MDEFRFNAMFPPALQPLPEAGTVVSPLKEGGKGEFFSTLKDAIEQTNNLQFDADAAVERMVTGGDQSLHQTLVALQEADVSFQLMMKIRNKIVTAYEEIQRMQI